MKIDKKGELEISEIAKIAIAVVILAVLIFAIALLFKGKGTTLLDSIKSFMHFGRTG